tara:strand:+ start:394 stop:651 length:258 start_codon:yes stop_codon:yes gene_type:complete
MNIGDLVWNNYHGVLRFGTIQSKRIDETGWAYYKVNWHADETYEKAMALRQRLSHKDYKLQEYRKDQITSTSKDFLSRVLEECTK